MKKLLSTTIIIINIVLILWCAVSTIEVASKNTQPNPQYSSINIWAILFPKTEEPAELVSISNVEPQTYTAYGRYYTDGTVITDDGYDALGWYYSTDTISDMTPYDAMPVWIGFSDNGTPDYIKDDIILGLVYDRETAIYDELETALGDSFETERDGNNIRVQTLKRSGN